MIGVGIKEITEKEYYELINHNKVVFGIVLTPYHYDIVAFRYVCEGGIYRYYKIVGV